MAVGFRTLAPTYRVPGDILPSHLDSYLLKNEVDETNAIMLGALGILVVIFDNPLIPSSVRIRGIGMKETQLFLGYPVYRKVAVTYIP